MWKRYAPPTWVSASREIISTPCGHHHFLICSGSVQALKTRGQGALKIRLITSRWSDDGELFIMFFLFLKLLQILVEAVQAAFPEFSVFLDPGIGLFHGFGFQFDGMNPPRTAAAHQPGLFLHAQMLGNGG